MSVNNIIAVINESLAKSLAKFKRVKIYGVAEIIQRKTGSVVDVLPLVINNDGEGEWVGLDDTNDIIIYHKISVVAVGAISGQQNKAFGNNVSDNQNTYAVQMIVYLDRKRTEITGADLMLILQAAMPQVIRMDPYKQIIVSIKNIILNTQAIFTQEYKLTEELALDKSMIAIVYQIESSFTSNCFKIC